MEASLTRSLDTDGSFERLEQFGEDSKEPLMVVEELKLELEPALELALAVPQWVEEPVLSKACH